MTPNPLAIGDMGFPKSKKNISSSLPNPEYAPAIMPLSMLYSMPPPDAPSLMPRPRCHLPDAPPRCPLPDAPSPMPPPQLLPPRCYLPDAHSSMTLFRCRLPNALSPNSQCHLPDAACPLSKCPLFNSSQDLTSFS